MEQKHVLLSALSVGVGLGVGLGLSTGQAVQKWVGGSCESDEISGEQIVLELNNKVIDGKNSKTTFDEFPYYLSERVRFSLTSAGYVYLKQDFSKHMRNLCPASRAMLLSGPAELYQQKVAQALAQCFGSKLLLLDIIDFSLEMQRKYGCPRKEPYFKRSISEVTLERVSGLFGSFPILSSTSRTRGTLLRQSSEIENSSNPLKLCRNASSACDTISSSQCDQSDPAPLKGTSGFCFDEKLFVQSLYKVLVSISETSSIILYIKDVEKLFVRSPRLHNLFQKLIKKLSGPVLILGSQIFDYENDPEIDDKLTMLFPYIIEIKPPQKDSHLASWKTKLKEDTKTILFQDSRNYIAEVLAASDIDCDDLNSVCHADTMLLSSCIEEIVAAAVSHHLTETKDPEYRNGKLVISAKSLSYVLSLFQESESNSETKDSNKDVPPDNEYEKRMRADVVPAKEIGVRFEDIGALDDIKEILQDEVLLPLRRPDLFNGGLLKPYKGILLFGPPGTGKTMLAKAIANEAGASFINVSISTITSKWFGEDEKNVRALFSLAAKVAPTIIFIDEVDSMLGQRTKSGEHEAMRKIKNEFMVHWDGLLSKPGKRILVLAATNRPYDLDEAIIRRFERRIMVGIPSAENREMILKTLLAKEKYENIDFKELSIMTKGYTGSDLKNLCTAAAYRPVRELLRQERIKENKKKEAAVQSSESASDAKEDKENRVITLRPINMDDMRQAKTQVTASYAAEGSIMSELEEWNDLFGEGGSRKKKQEQLTYFL
ncbi:spastin isoform X1 [Vigna radiata var. radiata]|uniref:Spastin isoform X1 n=1 Tax=Vigna radiata var. radiata TaxID=3916 RepID=A0A1S3V8I2_VIGRR|nr:spastin isoform X1 [Vigna radiata var. radiata]